MNDSNNESRENEVPSVNLSALSSTFTGLELTETEKTRTTQSRQLLLSGLLFLGLSGALFISIIHWLLLNSLEASNSVFQGLSGEIVDSGRLFAIYLTAYSPPLLTLVSASICLGVAYTLLSQAGALVRTAVPKEDRELLRSLSNKNKEGVDQYIRLNSLTGLTGFFTKIGITGLPLATITLTMAFGFLALLFDSGDDNSRFLDFANLTLGAFLGSYVQKSASESTNEKNNKS